MQRGYFLDVEEIAERERPPMLEIPDYVMSRHAFKKMGRK